MKPLTAEQLEATLAELRKSRACLVGADAATLAANPEDLEWWLAGLLERAQSAIGLLEQALESDEGVNHE